VGINWLKERFINKVYCGDVRLLNTNFQVSKINNNDKEVYNLEYPALNSLSENRDESASNKHPEHSINPAPAPLGEQSNRSTREPQVNENDGKQSNRSMSATQSNENEAGEQSNQSTSVTQFNKHVKSVNLSLPGEWKVTVTPGESGKWNCGYITLYLKT